MVREGLMPSLADASCCMVDVVNGGDGRRACSRRAVDATCSTSAPPIKVVSVLVCHPVHRCDAPVARLWL